METVRLLTFCIDGSTSTGLYMVENDGSFPMFSRTKDPTLLQYPRTQRLPKIDILMNNDDSIIYLTEE